MPKLAHSLKTYRFDQLASLVNDRVDDPAASGVERYVGLEHLDAESLRIRRWGEITDVESTKLRFQPGDIIFGKRRVYQRKLAVADFEGICSAHAMVLRPKSEVVVPEFLPFFMQSDLFMERALAISVGSLSPTINWTDLASEEFALPPVEEQRRLAAVVSASEDVLTSMSNLAEAAHTAMKAACVAFGTALLADDTIPLQTIDSAGELRMGRQRSPQYQTGSCSAPYLRVANVYDGFITTDDVLEMDFDESDFATYQLKPGDILLNEGQSRELVGRCAIYQGEVPRCCFQNTLIRFRSNKVIPEFAQSFFRFMLYSGKFASLSRQTSSMAHLGLGRFRTEPIRVPGLDEQRKRIQHIVDLEASWRKARTRADGARDLKRRLLAQCLSGESI